VGFSVSSFDVETVDDVFFFSWFEAFGFVGEIDEEEG
jgi:hypothetical protein